MLPECAWDEACGLIVLYREGLQARESGPYSLVVEPVDGQGAYYAGDLPPGEGAWVIRAPSAPRFRLLFYPADAEMPADGPPLAAIPFSAALRVDPQMPAAELNHISGWCFQLDEADDGRGVPGLLRVEVPVGERLHDVLAGLGWRLGDPTGIAIVRAAGGQPEAERGPASNPFGAMCERIEVRFTVVPDPRPLPDDAVRIDGFEQLEVPAIIVDLTPFGVLDEALREGFCFVHGPHGAESELICTYGTDVPIYRDEDGRRLLLWPCAEGCHLDLIGVHFSGGQPMVPLADEETDVQVHGDGAGIDEDADLLIAQFYGNDYRLLPRQALEARDLLGVDANSLTLRVSTDWIMGQGGWRDADWRGAERAGAFSQVAFKDLLGRLPRVEAAPSRPAALPQLVTTLRSFSGFAARPELGFALLRLRALAEILGHPGLDHEALFDPALLSPASAVAAAREPEVEGLAAWVEEQDPRTQALLWRFMLARGLASHWRDLAITPERVAGVDLARLARQLRVVMAPPALEAHVAVLDDLGMDTGPLVRAPRGLADVEARIQALRQANAAIDRELAAVNRDLAYAPRRLSIDKERAKALLVAALDDGGLRDAETMRERLLAHVATEGRDLLQFAGTIGAMVLRLTMLALAEALGLDLARAPVQGPLGPDLGLDPFPDPFPDPDPFPGAEGVSPPPPLTASGPGGSPEDVDDPGADVDHPGFEGPLVSSDRTPDTPDMQQRPEPFVETTARWPDLDAETLARTWVAQVLRRESLDPPAADAEPGQIAALQDELEGVEDYWGLIDGDVPEPLPLWRGERQAAAQRMGRQWDEGVETLRGHLGPDVGDGALDGLIRRLDRVRDCIIAEMLWGSITATAAGRRDALDDPGLGDLVERMGRAAPTDWDALAAELDTIAAPPTTYEPR